MARAIAYCTCKVCGKEFTKIAYRRNRTEADSFEAWATENCDICNDCYREGLIEAAKAEAAEAGFPQLTGSPKQIAWAEEIRIGFWRQYLELEEPAIKMAERHGVAEKIEKSIAECRAVFHDITEAKEYIDHRSDSLRKFLLHFRQEAEKNG